MLSPTETESHMQVGTVVQAIVSNPRNLQVDDLKQQIAHTTGVPADMLRLVHKGKAIHNDHVVSLSDQDIILAMRTRPPAAMHAAYEEELDPGEFEDTRVRLPANAPALERKLLAKLRHEYQLPEYILAIVFGIRLQTWLMLLAWLAGAPVAHKMQIGPIYVLGSIILVIFLNLGRRQQGEASAYSIFNNFQELPGQLNAHRLDNQLRRGQM